MGVLCRFCFWYALLYVLSSFAINLMRKRERAGCFAFLSFGCLVTVNVFLSLNSATPPGEDYVRTHDVLVVNSVS